MPLLGRFEKPLLSELKVGFHLGIRTARHESVRQLILRLRTALLSLLRQAAPEIPAVVETNLLADLPADFLEGNRTAPIAAAPPPVETVVELPLIWQKLYPAFGSAVFFLLPCFALAMISPYMIRLAAQQVTHVGTVSGLVYAASTAGSIGGVFVTAYFLIDHLEHRQIYQLTAGLTLGLAGLCFVIDQLWPEENTDSSSTEEASSSPSD